MALATAAAAPAAALGIAPRSATVFVSQAMTAAGDLCLTSPDPTPPLITPVPVRAHKCECGRGHCLLFCFAVAVASMIFLSQYDG